MSIEKKDKWGYHKNEGTAVMEKDRAEMLRNFENQWVALSKERDEVVASGHTLREAKEKADSKGYDDPVISFVSSTEYGYIPSWF